MLDRFSGFIPAAWPAGRSQTFRPGGGPVHDESIPLLWGGFRMTAEIEARGSATEGVICALGDWFGGYALYMLEGQVNFTFSRAADVLQLTSPSVLSEGRHQIGIFYTQGDAGGVGRMVLLVDDAPVHEIEVEGTLPFALQHGGAGLRLGFDSGFPVSPRYSPPAVFNGVVHHVKIDVPGAFQIDSGEEVRTALHRD
jgi:arylsulfatase